jgi:drug/metabolite transporter (DMT)-like permease
MLWLILSFISAVTAGMISIIHRFVVKDHDYISYSFIWQIFNALFFIPLLIVNFAVPSELIGWEVMLLGVLIWTLINFAGFKSVQLLEASLREPISQTKVLFALILSSVLISEVLTLNKIIGTVLIFSSLMIVTYRKGVFARFSELGIRLTLLTAFLWALVSVVDKTALKYWNVPSYAFMAFLLPGLIVGGFAIKRADKLVKMVKLRLKYLILVGVLGVISSYALFRAYQLTDVSNVFPVIQLSSLVTVAGGIILLKERGHVLQKIVATAIMLIGILFVSGYFVI